MTDRSLWHDASIFWNWFLTFGVAEKIFFDQFQKANEWSTLRGSSTKCVTVKVTNSVVLTDRADARVSLHCPSISSCTNCLRCGELRLWDELFDCALKMRGAGHF